MGRAYSIYGKDKMHTKLWFKNLKRRKKSFGKLRYDRKILKWSLRKRGGRLWAGLIWSIGTSGKLL
jgi:hypothetical protein